MIGDGCLSRSTELSMSLRCDFFSNDTATTEIYTYGHTLSLHDALPICENSGTGARRVALYCRHDQEIHRIAGPLRRHHRRCRPRSEEHTSELQSLMRISYADFCLKKKKYAHQQVHN